MPALRALADHRFVACYKRGSLPERVAVPAGA
jgi:hypothetical protein